ncbi:MAG: hypothetical protein KC496_22770, partial [Anaerolineae bacterium]|nr:hypothetical protein [Anaerolineae bacterium]
GASWIRYIHEWFLSSWQSMLRHAMLSATKRRRVRTIRADTHNGFLCSSTSACHAGTANIRAQRVQQWRTTTCLSAVLLIFGHTNTAAARHNWL